MYWLKNGNKLTTPTLPLITMGENYDTSLVFVTEVGEDLSNVSLCCLEYPGIVSAKKSTLTTYYEIMGVFNPYCFLGSISASTSTTVDFRILIPIGSDSGLRIIPVILMYGDGAEGPSLLWRINFTPALWTDIGNPSLWTDLREL